MARITESASEIEVTTITENLHDFGCAAPNSLPTLTLYVRVYFTNSAQIIVTN